MSTKRVRIERDTREFTPADQQEVGYGKPPAHSRFRPGQSGNPKGRPKGSRNFASDVMTMLKAPVRVSQDGKARKISTQKATLMRLREKALSGDARALDRLLNLARDFNNDEPVKTSETVAEDDVALFDVLVARVRSGALPSARTAGDAGTGSGADEEASGGDAS